MSFELPGLVDTDVGQARVPERVVTSRPTLAEQAVVAAGALSLDIMFTLGVTDEVDL